MTPAANGAGGRLYRSPAGAFSLNILQLRAAARKGTKRRLPFLRFKFYTSPGKHAIIEGISEIRLENLPGRPRKKRPCPGAGERDREMRLFVALQPSPAFREALADLQDRLRAAGVAGRYLDPGNLHLTLAFIGEWPRAVTEILPPVEAPFPITLSHIGIFQRARVLWAGVQPSEALNALAAQVRRGLQQAGIPYDPQAFNPHVTLIRKPVLPGDGLPAGVVPPPAAMTVREVCLYQSEHRAEGMAYTVIGRGDGPRGKSDEAAPGYGK